MTIVAFIQNNFVFIINIILFFVILLLVYGIIKVKLKLAFIEENYFKLLENLKESEQIKLNYVREIQDLKTRIEFIQIDNEKREKLNKEALNIAKASLLDLGNNLSKQLIALHKQETQESRNLSESNIYNTNLKFHQEFQKLLEIIAVLNDKVEASTKTVDIIKNSLLSPSGAGALAEITLENILKASGLRITHDFVMQCNLTNEENIRLRPDVLVFLPGDNLMIIDAKASKFLIEISSNSENTVEEKEAGLKKTMNLHLKSLSSKEYAQTAAASQLKTRSFNNIITLMFLPSEAAIEKLANIDKDFIHKSWEHNIFPVGPSGLMNMLSFARFQIKEQMRYENQKLILEEVKKIVLSINSLTEHASKLGNNIQNVVNNYDQFAASFNRNFLAKTKIIQKLGIEIGKNKSANNYYPMLKRYHLVSSKLDVANAEMIDDQELLINK